MLQNRILHKKANQTKTYRKIYENKKHTSHIRHNNTTQHKVWKHKGPDRNVVDPHFWRFLSLFHPEIFWKAGVQGYQIWHFIQTCLPKIFHWKIVFLNIFPPEVSQTKFVDPNISHQNLLTWFFQPKVFQLFHQNFPKFSTKMFLILFLFYQ